VRAQRHGALCQAKLLQGGEPQLTRTYPPSRLEWRANSGGGGRVALPLTLPDQRRLVCEVGSWRTAEQLGRHAIAALTMCAAGEARGWTLLLDEGKVLLFLFIYL